MKPITFAAAIYRLLNEYPKPATVRDLTDVLNNLGYDTSNNRVYLAVNTIIDTHPNSLLVEEKKHPYPNTYYVAKKGLMLDHIVEDIKLATIIGDLASLKELESRVMVVLGELEQGASDASDNFSGYLKMIETVEELTKIRARISLLTENGYPPIRDYLSKYFKTC